MLLLLPLSLPMLCPGQQQKNSTVFCKIQQAAAIRVRPFRAQPRQVSIGVGVPAAGCWMTEAAAAAAAASKRSSTHSLIVESFSRAHVACRCTVEVSKRY